MRHLRNAVKLVYSDIMSHMRPANVAMFHIGRVGSTVTTKMVGQHSQICWGGEFFYRGGLANWRKVFAEDDPLRLLRLVMPAARTGIFGIDCKIHETQDPSRLGGVSTTRFVQSLIERGFDHFIFLERRNLLRRFVSAEIGWKRKKRHRTEGRAELVQVHLDPVNHTRRGMTKPLTEWFKGHKTVYETARQQVAAYPTLNLTYEEDVLPGPHIAYKKICTFLDVLPEHPTISHKKVAPFPLDEILTNYHEVATYLQDTPYAWMLEDEKPYA